MTAKRKTDRFPATLVILAGGNSLRMRRDKANLPAPEEPLIRRVVRPIEPLFDEILISVSKGQGFDALPFRTVQDERESIGPMAGLLAGLKAAAHETCAVVACDIPDIDPDFMVRMLETARDQDIVVPLSGKDRYEPLLAVYKRSVVPRIEALIAAGDFSILSLFPLCRIKVLDLSGSVWLQNLNTPEDYEKYLKSLKRKD